jgi:tetratricopeptide (TPR) repeat protein
MARIAVQSGTERTGRNVRRSRALLALTVAAGLAFGAWKLVVHRQYRREMAEIKREIQSGRHGHAAQKLVALLKWKPDSDEAAYLLGTCEKARGQAVAAYRAWERVSPASSFGARAIRGLMDLLVERGRLEDAETLIIKATADPRTDGSQLRLFLGLIYSLQGRVEEGERLIESSWERLDQKGEGASETAILLLRLHIQLRQQVPPVEEVRAFLDPAGQSAPEDDRVWLGKANLAIRLGLYEDAARWLDRCLQKRPEDRAVWRTRLDWALATRRLGDIRRALTHLPVDAADPGQLERLTAWLAGYRGDLDSERRALERLVVVSPADSGASDRLVAIAQKDAETERAGELHRKRIEVEALQSRFAKLYQRNQTIRDAAEMSGLAEQLGQPFEAKVFRIIANATQLEARQLEDRRPGSQLEDSARRPSGRNLAEALANELDAAERANDRR